MDRIKRLSFEVLDVHKSTFGEDFVENKKALIRVDFNVPLNDDFEVACMETMEVIQKFIE